MKLLILAQVPPPLHGQSLMVKTAVDGLPEQGIRVAHVNLRLSRNHADIGGWRAGKLLALLDACCHAIAARFTERCDTLYYVPAPAKRGALYRDWLVMALCRPFFPRLVLHFHNGGLGEWITRELTAPERALTHALLGRADLALVLGESLRGDAAALHARRIAIVPNGIATPAATGVPAFAATEPRVVLFLGQCSADKGLLDAAAAVLAANRRAGRAAFRLVAAGPFVHAADAERFSALAAGSDGALTHAGPLHGTALENLWAQAACLCLPTHYAHEAQPLVVLEALARDVPIIATRWRAIPATLDGAVATLVEPHDVAALTTALLALRDGPARAAGKNRAVFLARYTRERHLASLATALG